MSKAEKIAEFRQTVKDVGINPDRLIPELNDLDEDQIDALKFLADRIIY